MDIASLINLLDDPQQSAEQLRAWKLQDVEGARAQLNALTEAGLTLDLLAVICRQLGDGLAAADDPDEVLRALTDFISASRSPLGLAALFERDPQALPTLLSVLSLGPAWRRMLVADPEAFDLLRMTDGQPVAGPWLKAEVCGEMAHFSDERHILAGLRRIKQRELLRIAYGDVYKRQRFELVSEQLTFLADALIEAAVAAARRKLQDPRADAKRTSGSTGRFAVIALGRLGGLEMDYGQRIDLLLIHEPLPDDDHARRAARDYFERLGRLVLRYLSEPFEGQRVYQAETPIQLENQSSPVAAADEALSYLDGLGRTWHREAMTKARAVAGDLELAETVLRQLQPWVYRRYLNQPDETGTRALKRRLQRRMPAGTADDVGAMVEQITGVVQFLQLLNGGDLPIVRATNTLAAIAGLEQAGVLTVEERIRLEDDYRTLRAAEHRRQLPAACAEVESPTATTTTAAEQGDETPVEPAPTPEAIDETLATALQRARETTTRLLESAFPNDVPPPAEVDLLLDPQPNDREIEAVLGRYGFKKLPAAYQHLQSLASERVPFLSTRRCRYFLSTIAPQLLEAVAATPDPDLTLDNLAQVSDSIGGKGVLWELFSFNPPSLQLYVRLCAASPYLSAILTTNPGMVDELVDSLQLARLPRLDEMRHAVDELTRSDRDLLSILHGFKHSHHLQIGVRELLGKETIDNTHRALADVAETCLVELIRTEYDKLVEKFGQPMIGFDADAQQPCRFAVLATGKLGGREPNYHSDVELIVVYEADGMTQLVTRGRREQKTANAHFFSQLTQRVTKSASQLTAWGRLYNVETPLRSPSGGVALSLDELRQQFEPATVPVRSWRAISQARTIVDQGEFGLRVESLLRETLIAHGPAAATSAAEEIRTLRAQQASQASPWNLKRAAGGSLDVECLITALQLRHAAATPEVLTPGTLAGIEALRSAGHLSEADATALRNNYRWLREVESALRLLNTEKRHDLPEDETALAQLALLVHRDHPEQLRDQTLAVMQDNHQRFTTLLAAGAPASL